MKITMKNLAVFQNGINFPKWDNYGKIYLNLPGRFHENQKYHCAAKMLLNKMAYADLPAPCDFLALHTIFKKKNDKKRLSKKNLYHRSPYHKKKYCSARRSEIQIAKWGKKKNRRAATTELARATKDVVKRDRWGSNLVVHSINFGTPNGMKIASLKTVWDRNRFFAVYKIEQRGTAWHSGAQLGTAANKVDIS
jgi:hypothetical protein